ASAWRAAWYRPMPRPPRELTGARIRRASISGGTALPLSHTRSATRSPHSSATCTRVSRSLERFTSALPIRLSATLSNSERGTRAGLVHGLQVARLAQLRLAKLGDVELGEQLGEEMQVPLQRGAEAIARVDGERDLRRGEFHRVRRALTPLALLPAGPPGHAG